mgnify:FL=1
MEKIKIAAIQMPTVADKMENVRTVKAYLEKIKDEKPDFVILSEMFCCPYQTENLCGRRRWPDMAAVICIRKTVWSLSDWGLHAGERCRRKCLQYMLCF